MLSKLLVFLTLVLSAHPHFALAADGEKKCAQILSSDAETRQPVKFLDTETLPGFETVEVYEVTSDSALQSLSPTGVVDFVKTYFTGLPEGILLGARDIIHNAFNENSVRPEFLLMDQRKAIKARLWRNHFGFFLHSAVALGWPFAFGVDPMGGAVMCINGLCSVKILVTTKALKKKHRLFQVFGYIK